MEMTVFEKCFVNRDAKVRRNIEPLRQLLSVLQVDQIRDVLELGCGIGGVSAFLAEKYGMNVCGTDYDPKQIAIAREKHPEEEHLLFQVEDASRLSFEDGSFDLVLAQDVFHHVAEWDSAIGEVARVLRRAGHFILMDFAYPRVVKQALKPFVKHYGLYTWDDLLGTSVEVGLNTQHVERLRHGVFLYGRAVLSKTPTAAEGIGGGSEPEATGSGVAW